jgi:hypothetical protein
MIDADCVLIDHSIIDRNRQKLIEVFVIHHSILDVNFGNESRHNLCIPRENTYKS